MADILLRGMETWKNCDDCQIGSCCPYDGHIDGYKMLTGRPKDCPAIFLPSDHGRLIDASPEKCESYLYQHLCDDHMIAAQNAIDDMPTIVPAEKEDAE